MTAKASYGGDVRLFEEQAFTISRRFTAPIVRMRIMATATKAGLANDLESLRAGTLSEAELRAKCRERVPSDLLNAIWPTLNTTLPIATSVNEIALMVRCKMPSSISLSGSYERTYRPLTWSRLRFLAIPDRDEAHTLRRVSRIFSRYFTTCARAKAPSK